MWCHISLCGDGMFIPAIFKFCQGLIYAGQIYIVETINLIKGVLCVAFFDLSKRLIVHTCHTSKHITPQSLYSLIVGGRSCYYT